MKAEGEGRSPKSEVRSGSCFRFEAPHSGLAVAATSLTSPPGAQHSALGTCSGVFGQRTAFFHLRRGPGLLRLVLLAALLRQPLPAQLPPVDARLQALLDQAVSATLREFAGRPLRSNQLAVTLLDLREPPGPRRASYRGEAPTYPASVIKLFYLVAVHRWLEDGRLADTAELRRAMRDMIVDSSNEATHYLVDLLTDTTSGPELPERELDAWFEKRNAVNRYFAALGYTNINANKKPWCEGPYGREMQSIQRQRPNRNLLTTDATARLLLEIVTGRAVTPARSAEMLKLLERDAGQPGAAGCEPHQAVDFTAAGLPPGARLWSKAGWTSETRHDAAYVELPGGLRFILVSFTTGHSQERGIIASITRQVVAGLAALKE